jgi:hypothetical protein
MFSFNHANRAARKKMEEMVQRKLTNVLTKAVTPITLSDDPVQWTEQIRKIQGASFSFADRPYLLPLYRDTNKDIYIVKPRQMEITEYSVNWLLYNLTKNPGTVGLYITDRQDHVSVFSKLRLRNWGIDQSPILKSMIWKGNVSWQPL